MRDNVICKNATIFLTPEMNDTDWSDNIFYQLDPDIDWMTTYVQRIDFKSSTLVILLDAGLMTNHPKFDESKISDPSLSVRMELRIIFNNVKELSYGGEKRQNLEIVLSSENFQNDQIADIEWDDDIYNVSFDHTETIIVQSQPPIGELGNYILSDTFLGSIDNGIDWSLSSLNEIQIGQDIVFHIAACLNSWHPRFEKTKVKGHWGKYQSTLRFPKVKDYRFEPNSKVFNSKIEFTPDSYQILEVIENIDEYQIFLGIWSESSNRKIVVNSEPPIFEIGEFISSGPFIRSPYPPRLNGPTNNEETLSELMGELKTPPKVLINRRICVGFILIPIIFTVLFLIAASSKTGILLAIPWITLPTKTIFPTTSKLDSPLMGRFLLQRYGACFSLAPLDTDAKRIRVWFSSGSIFFVKCLDLRFHSSEIITASYFEGTYDKKAQLLKTWTRSLTTQEVNSIQKLLSHQPSSANLQISRGSIFLVENNLSGELKQFLNSKLCAELFDVVNEWNDKPFMKFKTNKN